MAVNKIKLILQREYLTRIRKRSFILMTVIGPLLMAALMIIPIWLSLKDTDIQYIQVVDETYAFDGEIEDTPTVKFEFTRDQFIHEAKADFYNTNYTAILYIPKNAYSSTSGIRLFHKKQPSQRTINHINKSISDIIERDRLELKYNIKKNELSALKPDVNVMSVSLEEGGEEETTHTGLSMLLGFGSAVLIYFFIFLYGVQVMRGVIEEKTNRIIEVVISSVKPFQLMLGKIIGIALVGLTQFLLWVILTFALVSTAKSFIPDHLQRQMNQAQQMEEFIPEAQQAEKPDRSAKNMLVELNKNLTQINFPLIFFTFLFYFMGGYLLYAALFAAIGAAVDSEADTQQFMFPITVPLILAFVLAQSVIANPDGSLAFWFSIIPFTSPIIMMVRIPFGVGIGELMISMGVLVASFLFITWFAGRIYRTGILMYGKKPSYKELWKWLKYRD